MFTCTPADEPVAPVFGCLCHSPAIARINAMMDKAWHETPVSRRLALGGLAGIGAAAVAPRGAAAQGARPAPRPVLFTNVHVFDGMADQRSARASVLVEGHLVRRISTAAIDAAGATVIDGAGRTLMPGLIDMHWHSLFATIPQAQLLQADVAYMNLHAVRANRDALMRGFTTVRDVGGNVFGLHRATDEGTILGPRIFPSGGYISQTSGHGDFRGPNDVPANPGAPLDYLQRTGQTLVADGVPEVLRRTREVLRMGASQVKAMAGGGVSSFYDPIDVTQFTLAEMTAIVEAARNWNTYVTVHAFTDTAIRQAVEAGVRCIEHGHLLGEETLRLMAEKDVWLSMQPLLDDEDAIPFPEGSENRRKYLLVTAGTERVYRLAKAIGVKMVWGTDTLFDPLLATKQGKVLAKLGRWFTPVEALRQATGMAGQLLALSGPRSPYRDGPLGVLREGAYADMLLVEGNPLENLALVADPERNFKVIMKNGDLIKNAL